MVQTPVIAAIDLDQITQLTFFLVIVLLFAVYKTISRCLRHREKKMKIEKGIVGTQSKGAGSSKWIRSIYMAASLLLASSVFVVIIFSMEGGLSTQLFVFGVLPFCVGIAYLIRGILKRKSYIRRLCLNNGVPHETVYPPQKQWIFPLSLGLPLLIYGITLLTLGIVYNFAGGTSLGISILVASVLGGMFFLYGLLMLIVMSRRKAKTVSPQTTSTNRDVIANEHHKQETS